MSLTTAINISIAAQDVRTADFSTPNQSIGLQQVINLANGSSANQANLVFADRRTVGASSSDDIDLAGALTTPFGETLTFAKIKVLYIYNRDASLSLVVRPKASNGWCGFLAGTTPTLTIGPGGCLLLVAPDANGYGSITAGSADIMQIYNAGGASVDYDIAIVGA